MGIIKSYEVKCDNCLSLIEDHYLRVSSEDIPKTHGAHSIVNLGDLIFCKWDCIRRWQIKEEK